MPDELKIRICDRCGLKKSTIDISNNPIHTSRNPLDGNGLNYIDICIICINCAKYFLNRMRRLKGEEEIA